MNADDIDSSRSEPPPARAGEPVALPSVEPGVAIWWTDLDRGAGDTDRLGRCLCADERARAARFGTPALQRRYIAGRASLRQVLGRALALEPAAVPIGRGARGRPGLGGSPAPLDFNLSHTEGGAIIGIAWQKDHEPLRIGVDVEREDRLVSADLLARKFLSADERATLADLDADVRRRRFLRYWTCKEAMSKATGEGIAAPFGRLTVVLEPRPLLVAGPPPYLPDAWRLHAVAAPAGFVATVALWRTAAAGAVAAGPGARSGQPPARDL